MLNNYRRETIFVISIFLVSWTLRVKSIASTSQTKSTIMSLQSVTAAEVFSQKELDIINACWDKSKPQGKFLKDRHGFTHYCLNCSGQGPLIVLCHGLGTSMEAFEKISENLVNSGYSVLKYDYYGHGYSKHGGNSPFFAYDLNMFVDQLDDLLDHIEKEEGVKPAAICGHSTGGIVGVAANDRWSKEGNKRSIVPKLILVAPAFYAKKPIVARIADSIPGTFTQLMKTLPFARVLIGDAYMENGELAFAKDPESKTTIYAAEEQKKKDRDLVLFGKVKGKEKHPFLSEAILNINFHILRGDLLEGHRELLKNVLKKTKSEILWIWGNLDFTVPFEDNIKEVKNLEQNFDNLEVSVEDRLGHESPYENPKIISDACVSFLTRK